MINYKRGARWAAGILLILLALWCGQIPVHAAQPTAPRPAITLVHGGDAALHNDFVVGYKFTVLTPLAVTDLGIFDKDGDGVLKGTDRTKIGLWNDQSELLASAEIPLNTKADNGAFYIRIKPVVLQPGSYVIAMVSPDGGERYWFNSEIETAPQIKWEQGRYASGTDLSCPTTVAQGNAYFGPNFKFVTGPVAPPDSHQATGITINQPDDHAVYQRNENNTAVIPIECSALHADAMQARAFDLKAQQAVGKWATLHAGNTPDSFTGSLNIPAGWYRLDLRAMHDNQTIASATVDHIGVGEVFLTAAQSN